MTIAPVNVRKRIYRWAHFLDVILFNPSREGRPSSRFLMSIDPQVVPVTLDLFHLVLGALVVILFLLTLVLALLPFLSAKQKKSPADVSVDVPGPPALMESQPAAALQLLGLLQQEARFIDFIEEDLQHHADADIGAAARVVHEGCRRVIQQHLKLEPVMVESEGTRVTLEKGFNAGEIRITGNIVGSPPFQGSLIHKGWKVRDIRLPLMAEGHDPHVLAPAEVEL